MVGQDYGTTGLRKNSQGEIVQVINKHVIVSLVYITLVLDNILLTVVGKYTQDSLDLVKYLIYSLSRRTLVNRCDLVNKIGLTTMFTKSRFG